MKLAQVTLVIAMTAMLFVSTPGVDAQAPKGHRELIIKFFDEVWDKGNVAFVDEAMTKDVVRFGHTDEGTVSGIDAYKAFVQKVRGKFTDYKVSLVEEMGVGNRATITWRLQGNYVGPNNEFSPGREIDLTGKSVWFFEGNKVSKEISEVDADEYYRQIQMAEPYSELQNRALLLGLLYAVYQDDDIDGMSEFVAQNHILHDRNGKEVVGLKAFQDRMRVQRAAFPDMKIAISDVVADGNLVTARWTISGTHRGAWLGVGATERRIVADGMSMSRIKDDKIQESWIVLDEAFMLEQITTK